MAKNVRFQNNQDIEDELEALRAIFGQEFQQHENNQDNLQPAHTKRANQHQNMTVFDIIVYPDAGFNEETLVSVKMTFRLTPKYPKKESPKISVYRNDLPGSTAVILSDAKLKELRSFAAGVAHEYLGNVCVMDVVNAVREELTKLNVPSLNLYDQMIRRGKDNEPASLYPVLNSSKSSSDIESAIEKAIKHYRNADTSEQKEIEKKVAQLRNARKLSISDSNFPKSFRDPISTELDLEESDVAMKNIGLVDASLPSLEVKKTPEGVTDSSRSYVTKHLSAVKQDIIKDAASKPEKNLQDDYDEDIFEFDSPEYRAHRLTYKDDKFNLDDESEESEYDDDSDDGNTTQDTSSDDESSENAPRSLKTTLNQPNSRSTGALDIPSGSDSDNSNLSRNKGEAKAKWEKSSWMDDEDVRVLLSSRLSASLNDTEFFEHFGPESKLRKNLFLRQLLRRFFTSTGRPVKHLIDITPTGVLDSQEKRLLVDPKDSFRFKKEFSTEIGAAAAQGGILGQFWASIAGDSQISVRDENESNKMSSRFGNDFQVLKPLGFGGFGSVVKAQNKLDGHVYAIKRIPMKRSDLNQKNILREVLTLSCLTHPNVVRYYQAWLETKEVSDAYWMGQKGKKNFFYDGSTSGLSSSKSDTSDDKHIVAYLYIQMEYCRHTLREFIDHVEDYDIDLWSILRQIIEGLHYIHSRGIVHRDLKPTNIFFAPNGDVKIGDFGLATTLYGNSNTTPHLVTGFSTGDLLMGQNKDSLAFQKTIRSASDFMSQHFVSPMEQFPTESSGRVGTLLYRAPEVDVSGSKTINYSYMNDIFSLGIIAWELWHGPFNTGHERYQALTHLRETRRVDDELIGKLALQCRLINDCLRLNPTERPSTSELLDNNYLPAKVEDEYIRDTLRQISTPGSRVRSQAVDMLFYNSNISDVVANEDSTENSVIISISEANEISELKERIIALFRQIFRRHGALLFETPSTCSHVSNPNLSVKIDELEITEKFGTKPYEVMYLTENGEIHHMRKNLRNGFLPYALDSLTILKRYEIGPIWTHGSSVESGETCNVIQRRLNHYLDDKSLSSPGKTVITEMSAEMDITLPLKGNFALDVEIVKIGLEVGRSIPVKSRIYLRLGHSELTKYVLAHCGCPANNIILAGNILSFTPYLGWPKVKRLLLRHEFSNEQAEKFSEFTLLRGKAHEVLPKLASSFAVTHGITSSALTKLMEIINKKDDEATHAPKLGSVLLEPTLCVIFDQICKVIEQLELLEGKSETVIVDPVLSLYPHYGSGIIFDLISREQSLKASTKKIECLAEGGHWDHQLKYHAIANDNEVQTAVGIRVHLDSITSLCHRSNRSRVQTAARSVTEPSCDVFVCSVGKSNMVDERLKICNILWNKGIRCEYSYLDNPGTMQDQIELATTRGALLIVVLKEHGSLDRVRVKNLTGRIVDREIEISNLASYIQSYCDEI